MTTPKLKEFFQPGLLIVLGMGGHLQKNSKSAERTR